MTTPGAAATMTPPARDSSARLKATATGPNRSVSLSANMRPSVIETRNAGKVRVSTQSGAAKVSRMKITEKFCVPI